MIDPDADRASHPRDKVSPHRWIPHGVDETGEVALRHEPDLCPRCRAWRDFPDGQPPTRAEIVTTCVVLGALTLPWALAAWALYRFIRRHP